MRLSAYMKEPEILKDIKHASLCTAMNTRLTIQPNIISIQKVFLTPHSVYIFQELLTGGDLFSYIDAKEEKCLSEVESMVITRQILKAVEYLHKHFITHRDIKPDNILMSSWKRGARVVLTDFGHAHRKSPTSTQASSNKRKRMHTVVGTLEYAAPEIHGRNKLVSANDGYSEAIDMWSIGAVTSALLTGDVLFVDRDDEHFADDPLDVIMDLASHCDLSVLDDPNNDKWSRVGRGAKAFIKSLLVLDESVRLTATQALQHAWFTKRSYAQELQNIYDIMLEEWNKKSHPSTVVQELDTSDLGPSPVEALTARLACHSQTSSFFPLNASPASPGA